MIFRWVDVSHFVYVSVDAPFIVTLITASDVCLCSLVSVWKLFLICLMETLVDILPLVGWPYWPKEKLKQ